MKVLLAIGSLRAGGAERVMSLLAGEFVRRGHAVALATMSSADDDFYPLPDGVDREVIGLEVDSSSPLEAVMMNFRRIRALRQVFSRRRPDVVLSFLTTMNVLCGVASIGQSHGLVVSERVDPSRYSAGRLWDLLRAVSYRRAAVLVVQAEPIANWFRSRTPSRAGSVKVIPNPVSIPDAHAGWCPREERALPGYVLAVGRLEPQKGFDVLVDAFAQLAPGRPGLQLRIAGSGSQRCALEARAIERGIADRVQFLGQVVDTPDLMSRARLFALPSRFEGFPNALLEAMACGAPCVAADCPTGPRELLGADEHGLLVPVDDVQALATAMARLLDDAALASRYGAAGRVAARRYSLGSIVDEWEVVLRGATRP